MTAHLFERCLVEKVYASVQTNSTDIINERDVKKNKVEISALKNVKGNSQGEKLILLKHFIIFITI
jgi:hypothetical protein